MKKDRISLIILLFEVVAIVGMHASKNEPTKVTQSPAVTIQPAPIFTTSTLPSSNTLSVFAAEYAY
ncbi:MAG: hypothetical protein H7Y31_04730 [Chitinophagaceae bacterium]|nr:hypothetical protein [Chitinophagaceae bacterium]